MARIEMILTSAPGKPEGDLQDRIALRAGLTSRGYLDIAAWFADPEPWQFTRSHASGIITGDLVREGETWALRGPFGIDDPLWMFESTLIRPGEYVTLRSPRGDQRSFRVVAVTAEA